MDCQLRLRAGILRNTMKASTAPPPAPAHPPKPGRSSWATAAVVLILMVPVPVVVVELRATDDPPDAAAHVGK
jgi:hypothetical protein